MKARLLTLRKRMAGSALLYIISVVMWVCLAITGCWMVWQLAFQYLWPMAPIWLSKPSLIKFGSACVFCISIVILAFIGWGKHGRRTDRKRTRKD